MDRREALRQQFAEQPLELIEHVLKLEAELAGAEAQLSATQARLAEVQAQLVEAQAYIEELQRRLLRNQAESLSPEQKHKLDQLRKDLLEQAQRPGPLSQQVLEEEEGRQPPERQPRPHRHPLPTSLEVETVRAGEHHLPVLWRRAKSHRRRSHRRARLGSGQADSPPHRAAQVRLPLWRIDGHRALTVTVDPAEQAGSGAGGVYRVDAL